MVLSLPTCLTSYGISGDSLSLVLIPVPSSSEWLPGLTPQLAITTSAHEPAVRLQHVVIQ